MVILLGIPFKCAKCGTNEILLRIKPKFFILKNGLDTPFNPRTNLDHLDVTDEFLMELLGLMRKFLVTGGLATSDNISCKKCGCSEFIPTAGTIDSLNNHDVNRAIAAELMKGKTSER